MKRFLILFMLTGLVAGSVATAEAKKAERKRVERTVKGTYGPYPAPVTGCNEPHIALGASACLVVHTGPRDAFFTAKVTDAHGQPVFVEVIGGGGPNKIFCGETAEPIAISPGSSLRFHIGLNNWPGHTRLDCHANRVKTTGTISVTLSNLP